jgi:Na+-translocating ferredoxin:NAD+ oxidoreductase subunit E
MNALGLLKDGLWTRNIVLNQLLALCPLLAVSTTAVNGFGLGLATTAVLILSNVTVSGLRRFIHPDIRIPCFIVVIASLVTVIDQLMNAYVHDLHKVLGLFIPLIVTNCAVLGRAESFAYKNGVVASALDGLGMGVGFAWSLTLIGAIREVVGSGTLFSGAALLGGAALKGIELKIIPDYRGFTIALLPPGGFLAVGFVLAVKASWERSHKARMQVIELPVLQGN